MVDVPAGRGAANAIRPAAIAAGSHAGGGGQNTAKAAENKQEGWQHQPPKGWGLREAHDTRPASGWIASRFPNAQDSKIEPRLVIASSSLMRGATLVTWKAQFDFCALDHNRTIVPRPELSI